MRWEKHFQFSYESDNSRTCDADKREWKIRKERNPINWCNSTENWLDIFCLFRFWWCCCVFCPLVPLSPLLFTTSQDSIRFYWSRRGERGFHLFAAFPIVERENEHRFIEIHKGEVWSIRPLLKLPFFLHIFSTWSWVSMSFSFPTVIKIQYNFL